MPRPLRAALALAAALAATASLVAAPRLTSGGPDAAGPAPTTEDRRDPALAIERDGHGAIRALTPVAGPTTGLGVDELLDAAGADLGPGELVRRSSTPRVDGGTAIRFQQEIGGIPVLGAEASVQVDAEGRVLSSLADLSAGVPETPGTSVGADDARRLATAQVVADTGVPAAGLTSSRPTRWWYDPEVLGAPTTGGTRLTWRIEVGDGDLVRRLVLVDVATGAVAADLDLLGDAADRRVCDFQGLPAANETCGFPTRVEGQGPTGSVEVDRAYDALGAWHDFFEGRFGWDGWDGTGTRADIASVRICRTPCPYPNAHWTGTQAVFGQGYAVDDVVAHEMTHGVTQATAGLFFSHQSGALNESFSDVLGELVDLSAGGDDTAANRWLMGEDLPGGPLRDLADPTAYGDPDRTGSSLYTAGPGDAGGVHTNSGVGNRAAVLLADGGSLDGHTVRAIGPEDAALLWFTVLSAHLTSGSDWADLAVALPQACRDLVGTGGLTDADCAQVDEAVAAVEMAEPPANAPATEAPVCAAGQTAVDLFADDLETPTYAAWTSDTAAGWHWPTQPISGTQYAHSGDQNLWGPNTGQPGTNGVTGNKPYGDARITLADPVPIPEGVPVHLRFDHAYAFHQPAAGGTADGGVVEVSTDGGTTWLPLTAFTENGYPGSIAGAVTATNPLGGRAAFVGESLGYVASRADLSAFAGADLQVRFRLTEDASGGGLGWYVDDVRIYSCPPTGPQATVTQAVEPARVVAGDPVGLAVEVTNTGTEPLTGLALDTPEAPGCTGPVPDLAPGEDHTVECERATVAPDDVGPLTSTATLTATELGEAVVAEPVTVEVLEPASAELAVSQVTAQDVVVAGEGSIDLAVTVRNTGAVPVTQVVVTTPEAPACAGPLADELGPGEEAIAECAVETTDPTDVGTFVSTASATSAEVTEPVAAGPVEVTVVAPDREDPSISVTSPVQAMVVNLGDVVLADYRCDDDSGWVDCVGTVADGEPIDTSTTGTQFFSVQATDLDGRTVEGGIRTYTVVDRRPDGRIRQGAGTTMGEDLYNASGAGQNRVARVLPNGTVTFFVTAQNDGSHPDRLRVRGRPGTSAYAVRYLSGGVDITGPVRTGTYRTPVLAPGQTRTIKVVVTVRGRAAVGTEVDRTVTVLSDANPARRDVVRFIVRRR